MTYRLSCPRSCQLRTAFPCFSTLIYQPHSPLPEIIISPMRVSLFRKYRLAKLKQGLGNLAPSLKDESKRRRRRRKKERKEGEERSIRPSIRCIFSLSSYPRISKLSTFLSRGVHREWRLLPPLPPLPCSPHRRQFPVSRYKSNFSHVKSKRSG